MSQAWWLVAVLALVLCGRGGQTAGFTDAEAEAAREGMLEVLDAALAKMPTLGDELELPPSFSEEVRRVAFVKVDTVKEVKNIKMNKLSSLQLAGIVGADPIRADSPATFTLPLGLDAPHLTGDLVRKVNDVGPTGHFNTTIGVYKMEATGLAAISPDSCQLNITAVRDTEVGGVDTQVEGASLLNRVLASEMSNAVRSGTLPFREQVSHAVQERLQAELDKQDCVAVIKKKLAKVAAPAA